MSWTEPTYSRAFIRGVLTSHPGILSRITLYEGEQAGNKISIPYFEAGTVASMNVDSITASSRNDAIMTLTATDKLRRTALKPSEYQSFLNDPSMGVHLFEEHADSLRKDLEDALDTELATSTNTVSLATDTTFTLAKFMEGLADPLDSGESVEDCTFISNAGGWASMVTAGYANAGGSLSTVRGSVGVVLGAIPCIVSANMTADLSAGPAGYLWAKRGIVCALGDIDTLGPVRNSGTGSWDIVSTVSYAFDTVGGASSKLVVQFKNA